MRSTHCLTGAFATALIALGFLCPVAGAGTGGFGKKFNYQYTVESIHLSGVFYLSWQDRFGAKPDETWAGTAFSRDDGDTRRPVRLPPNNGSGLQNYLPRGGRWRRTPVGRIAVPPYSRAIGIRAAYFRRGRALEDSFFTAEEPDVKFECRTERHTLKQVEAQLSLDPEERSESKLFSHPARVMIKWDTQSLIDDIECRNSEGEGFSVAYPREEQGVPPADNVRFQDFFYPLKLFRRQQFKLEIAINTAWNLDGENYIHPNWEFRDPTMGVPPGYNDARVRWEGEVTLRRTKSLPTK